MTATESAPNEGTTKSRACPACGGEQTTDDGQVLHPKPPLVAGVEIDLGDTSFHLRRCGTCGLVFKDPAIPEEKLIDCYRRGAGARWGVHVDPRARRFELIRHLLDQKISPGRRVLDIGCSNGDLLQYLSTDWEAFGVEPGEEAAAMATRRGVKILGPAVDALPIGDRFDAVTAIDVVEHIPNPRPFFQRVADLLEPGGVLVIVTGDSSAWSWRLMGSKYWYCSIPEHVSFYSRRPLDEIGRRMGLAVTEYHRISHQRLAPRWLALECIKNAGYLVGRSVHGLGIPSLKKLFVERGSPGWLGAKDHLFCAMRKPGPAGTLG